MDVPEGVAWLVFLLVVVGTVLFASLVVKYYAHPTESRFTTNVVTVGAMSCTLMCLLLIPLDIYCVSSSTDTATGQALISQPELETRRNVIQGLYYALFSVLLVLVFIAIPFSYFLFEEEDEELSFTNRILSAIKYTILFLIILFILLVCGLIIGKRSGLDKEWMNSILGDQERGDGALIFIVSCQVLVGIPLWIFYTSYGLAFFPISLLGKGESIEDQHNALSDELAINREKAREIQSRYLLTGKKMSKGDRRELDRLLREERLLSRRVDQTSQERGGGCMSVVWTIMAPMRFAFGVVFLVLTSIVSLSTFICVLDKAVNSNMKAGYIVDKEHWFNPFDRILVLLHRAFPLDYAVLVAVVVYVFIATLYSILRMGIRVVWLKLFSIRPRGTHPQGLITMALILIYTSLVLCMTLVTIAPQYTTFGTQTISVSGSVQRCSVELTTVDAEDAEDGAHCTMTQISIFINRISVNSHFFAIAFYGANWTFMIALAFWVGVALARPRMFTQDIVKDEFEDREAHAEPTENTGLLSRGVH